MYVFCILLYISCNLLLHFTLFDFSYCLDSNEAHVMSIENGKRHRASIAHVARSVALSRRAKLKSRTGARRFRFHVVPKNGSRTIMYIWYEIFRSRAAPRYRVMKLFVDLSAIEQLFL